MDAKSVLLTAAFRHAINEANIEAGYERFRAVVRSEPLLLVRGRYEHSDRNRNVLVDELVSLAPLARSLTDGADVHAALPRAHHFGHR